MENEFNNPENENEGKEPALKYGYISPKVYLGTEQESLDRHAYFNGCGQAMAVVSRNHVRKKSLQQ